MFFSLKKTFHLKELLFEILLTLKKKSKFIGVKKFNAQCGIEELPMNYIHDRDAKFEVAIFFFILILGYN